MCPALSATDASMSTMRPSNSPRNAAIHAISFARLAGSAARSAPKTSSWTVSADIKGSVWARTKAWTFFEGCMRTSSETTLVSNKTLVIYDWPFSNGFPRRDFRKGSSRSSPRGAVSTSHAPSAEGCKLSQVLRDMTTHASSVIPIRCGSPALARRKSSDSCALASWTVQVSLEMAVLLVK